MTTEEKNIEIARMLGWKQIKDLEAIDETNEHLKDCWFLTNTESVFWESESLKFSTDYNWIMDAVQYICGVMGHRFYLISNEESVTCVFTDMHIVSQKHKYGSGNIVVEYIGKDNLDAIFNAVAEYAVIYNKENQEYQQ